MYSNAKKNKIYKLKKVSGIGIGHFGIEYRRYSKQSIGIGIGHHGIVPSLVMTLWPLHNINIIMLFKIKNIYR